MMNRTLLTFALLLAAITTTDVIAQRVQRDIQWVNNDIADVAGLAHKVLDSKTLGHDVGYVVWTPPDYIASDQTRYPVVYFLHGAGGSESSDSGGFSSLVSAAIRARQFPRAICVFPNGGMSGYRDGVETMITEELIPLIDREYRTQASASGRVIAGFSMGGAGSVYLSMRHPGLFCAAGSWGGALSWQGTGEDSPLLSTANKNGDELKANGFSLLTINGDMDRPEGFTPLRKVLLPLGISHKTVTLNNTQHNLGHYYERSSETLLAFLAEQLGDSEATANAVRKVRVLTIGNSFAVNACRFLKTIAADGDVEMVIGTANLGGCTLERHATLARESQDDPSQKPYLWVSENQKTQMSLLDYLQAQQWDYVTLQQMSALSFRPETYHPHIDQLVALIHEHAPQATILLHQTWAYRPDSPLLQEWGMSQDEMHSGIVHAYAAAAQNFNVGNIPVGNAFHEARRSPGHRVVVPDPEFDYEAPTYPQRPNQKNSLITGWYWNTKDESPKLRLDFKHANTAGCYLAGLVWYETLTGNNAQEIRYVPKGLPEEKGRFLRSIAHKVVQQRAKSATSAR